MGRILKHLSDTRYKKPYRKKYQAPIRRLGGPVKREDLNTAWAEKDAKEHIINGKPQGKCAVSNRKIREKRIKSPDITNIREIALKYSKELKENATKAELLLHNKLTELGIQFRFQHPQPKGSYRYGFYIPDFTFKGKIYKHVFVEIDGSYHDERKIEDAVREWKLVHNKRIVTNKMLRFTNDEVFANVDDIIKQICMYIG